MLENFRKFLLIINLKKFLDQFLSTISENFKECIQLNFLKTLRIQEIKEKFANFEKILGKFGINFE